VTGTYRGYNTTGTSYSQATTVANDIIVTQSIPTYNEVGNIISQASYDRLNDVSTSITGALTGSIARVSYVAGWFDGIDRNIASANYGAISSFTRPGTPPASSSTVLVSSIAYDNAGRVSQTTDPKGIVTQTSYDAAGRTTQTIEDFGTGKLNRTTNTAYTLDNRIATLTAVNGPTGNQITTYTYGTTLASSGVARNDLLAAVAYPDSVSGSDVVAYSYNRLGEQLTTTDQRGTVRTFYRDKLGRQTNDCVTTVGNNTDNAVLQIATAYEVRGMPSSITSYNSATQNSGTVQNQVQLTYNTFGQLITEQQDHAAAVSGSTPQVQYSYSTAASGTNQIRPSTLTYPNSRIITSSYGTSGGMNDRLNRIDTIQDTTSDTTNLASYAYLGSGTVVRITYPQPSVWLDLWGGTSGTFNGLDQFNRVTDQRWQNNITATPTDIDRYQYGYDQNSNRTYKANVVGTPVVTGGLDEYYSYDNLNRLTEMQRGTLSSGNTGINGTPAREMDYTLDPTGNWSAYVTKTSGTTDLSQTRTSNKVNEITAISSTPAWSTPPAYDAAGNMTSFPQPASPSSNFTATYDAWNRMTSISSGGSTVATYQYDGRGRRIVKVTAAISETRHFYYTNSWQNIEERTGTSTSMDKQYIWGARYIDELMCRDDATPLRFYATQDANFNVTSIANTTGSVAERYLFDPYGTRTILSGSWRAIGDSASGWDSGYQGLMHDQNAALIYTRYRWINSNLGIFIRRDPHKDFVNSYEFGNGSPINHVDPYGLEAAPCSIQRMDELRHEYLNARNTYYPGEPNSLRNLTIDEVIQLSERAFWDECDRSKTPSSPSSGGLTSGGSSAAMCCFAFSGRLATVGGCCEAEPGPGTVAGTTILIGAGVVVLIGGIIYVCSKSDHSDDSSSSTYNDCMKTAGSAIAWVAFCNTLADPQARALCLSNKSTSRTSPQERKNWCYNYFGA
jgi:RHS repeat-associated protein